MIKIWHVCIHGDSDWPSGRVCGQSIAAGIIFSLPFNFHFFNKSICDSHRICGKHWTRISYQKPYTLFSDVYLSSLGLLPEVGLYSLGLRVCIPMCIPFWPEVMRDNYKKKSEDRKMFFYECIYGQ